MGTFAHRTSQLIDLEALVAFDTTAFFGTALALPSAGDQVTNNGHALPDVQLETPNSE